MERFTSIKIQRDMKKYTQYLSTFIHKIMKF